MSDLSPSTFKVGWKRKLAATPDGSACVLRPWTELKAREAAQGHAHGKASASWSFNPFVDTNLLSMLKSLTHFLNLLSCKMRYSASPQ